MILVDLERKRKNDDKTKTNQGYTVLSTAIFHLQRFFNWGANWRAPRYLRVRIVVYNTIIRYKYMFNPWDRVPDKACSGLDYIFSRSPLLREAQTPSSEQTQNR